MRRARGYAPLPIIVKRALPPLLAVGGHLKNTVAVSRGNDVILSQHIGDLETAKALFAFRKVIADLLSLYEVEPVAVAHDAHPDYLSTQWAKESRLPGHRGPAPSRAPGGLHGGERPRRRGAGRHLGRRRLRRRRHALGRRVPPRRRRRATAESRTCGRSGCPAARRRSRSRDAPRSACCTRWARTSTSCLQPGDAGPLSEGDLRLLGQMLAKGVNSPVTTSAGRLFDAVAALLGIRSVCSFEGQAAMMVEFRAERGVDDRYDVRAARGRAAGAGLGAALPRR